MLKTRQSVTTIALALAAALFCSGCPALMVPGLAYSGYKYEHDKNQTAATTPSAQGNKSASSSEQQNIPDNSIE